MVTCFTDAYVRDPAAVGLADWGRVTHICVSKITIIGSVNRLSLGRRQAIIWTNDEILLIGVLGTNFSEILIEIQTFSFWKNRLKVSSSKWRPFCLGLNELRCMYSHSEHTEIYWQWFNLIVKCDAFQRILKSYCYHRGMQHTLKQNLPKSSPQISHLDFSEFRVHTLNCLTWTYMDESMANIQQINQIRIMIAFMIEHTRTHTHTHTQIYIYAEYSCINNLRKRRRLCFISCVC